MANVNVTYEAMNSFGVNLSNIAHCRYSMIGEPKYASYKIISVNIGGNEIADCDIISLSALSHYKIRDESYFNKVRYIIFSLTDKI